VMEAPDMAKLMTNLLDQAAAESRSRNNYLMLQVAVGGSLHFSKTGALQS